MFLSEAAYIQALALNLHPTAQCTVAGHRFVAKGRKIREDGEDGEDVILYDFLMNLIIIIIIVILEVGPHFSILPFFF